MLKKLFALMFVCSVANAATWYISPTGNDTTGSGTTGSPWATLEKAFGEMDGGDTLICKDGTYTGSSNVITSGQCPPLGSSGAWTIVKAENDGEAVFDGQDTRMPVYVDEGTNRDRYWQFEGLVFTDPHGPNPSFQILNSNYIKILRCGSYEAGSGGTCWSISRNCQYILLEGCYAYGDGRYKFAIYQSSHVVLRNCVARFDRVDNPNNPIAVYSIYSCTDVEVQNCIAIDSDQTTYYVGADESGGAFYCPATDMHGERINFVNCMALNVKMGMGATAANYQSDDVTYSNCIFWDIEQYFGQYTFFARSDRTTFNGCTIGDTTDNLTLINADGDDATIKNSIFYNIGNPGTFSGIATYDYNAYWACTSTPTLAAHDINNVNPLTNSLLYLPRIEAGSDLDGTGEDNSSIGADAVLLVGTSGTLWGETGYNTATNVSMWPFPNEDLIKTKMAAYTATGVTGARGFCASGKQLNGVDDITLTSYVWEYLGNEMPAEIYGKSEPVRRRLSISGGVTITGGVQLK